MINTKRYGKVDLEELDRDLFDQALKNHSFYYDEILKLWEEYLKLEGYFWDEENEKWYDDNNRKYLNFWGGHDAVALAEFFLGIPKYCLYEWAIDEGKIYKKGKFWTFK